ncbi:hypothetical protein yc1106_06201 [Curvularia clavata]|uniref:DUF1772-domain-containing protein n=1 Tax=Curvularia clavata TaxID=95742 RepID=A0A9Q8Z9G2_CURCL|nr:hypothetical protein yc1106_06201 [Curvularia clavata]
MTTNILEVLSISTALIASGGIASFSLFDIPILKSQPASRSLPMVRWLFSRGSHIFPTAGILSSAGFCFLSYYSIPSSSRTSLGSILSAASQGKSEYYALAALLCISIAPITSGLMIPTNFTLIAKNEELGGSRSAKSAEYREEKGLEARTADDSVDSKQDVSQWRDLSGPQEKTQRESTEEEDKEVRQLLEKFAKLNMLRAVAIAAGGMVGLMGALA